jgi:glycosyltransferase involved in cell wall biosynthesis
LKLAFVVQRYGADIAGGSEGHCRELAERLASRHDITILTTCARDYVTWQNTLPAATTIERGVRVTRFPVAQPRRLKVFADLSDEVFDGHPAIERQEAWFRENGPLVPALLDHLRVHGREYDLVLFWTFRYYPSFFGLPLVDDRAVLVPTAEEDPAIRLPVVEDYLRRPAGFLFLTPEEEALVSTRAGRSLQPSATIGIGLEPVASTPSRAPLDALGIPSEYLLYLGRVDRNKGCDTLLEYFQRSAARPDAPAPTLVLAGPAKLQLLAHARALIVPSRYESLSIVLLEAWNYAVPALVNAHCRVLAGQVTRADGGLYYRSFDEFAEGLSYLLTHSRERHMLGRQGRAYVDREYRWPTVLARVEALLAAAKESRTLLIGDS